MLRRASRVRLEALPSGLHLCSEDQATLGPGVPGGPQNRRLAKSCGEKLVEEGATLLGTCDSGEPVDFRSQHLARHRFLQYQLGGVHQTTSSDCPGELSEDRRSVWIQIEDAVD